MREELPDHIVPVSSGMAVSDNEFPKTPPRNVFCLELLLHYKHMSGSMTYAEQVVRERSFYQGSAEYRSYLELLERDPDPALYPDDARELHHPDQIVEEGFFVSSEGYAAWAEQAVFDDSRSAREPSRWSAMRHTSMPLGIRGWNRFSSASLRPRQHG